MKSFKEFINESMNECDDVHVRSGRLLTQEQVMCNEIYEKAGDMPAVMFTDVVGSSQMWSDDTLTMKSRIDNHFELITEIAEKYNGFVVKSIGDAFMIYFEGKDALEMAIECGIEIIKHEALPLRVGICEGPMQEKVYVLQDAKLRDFFGNAVNVASRMESKVADPEGIAFSSMDVVSKDLIEKYGAEKLSPKKVPNLKGASVDTVYKIKA